MNKIFKYIYVPSSILLISICIGHADVVDHDTHDPDSNIVGATTQTNDFYIHLNDSKGSMFDNSLDEFVTYDIYKHYAPSDQISSGDVPGSWNNDNGEIQFRWYVGRHDNGDAASWFDDRVVNKFSAVVGPQANDSSFSKTGKKMNFAWTGAIKFLMIRDDVGAEYCDENVPFNPPTDTYELHYVLGQSGTPGYKIAYDIGDGLYDNINEDMECAEQVEEDGDISCAVQSVKDWSKFDKNIESSARNVWYMGLQAQVNSFKYKTDDETLAAGYMNKNFKIDDKSGAESAVYSRLLIKPANNAPYIPISRAKYGDGLGGFFVHAMPLVDTDDFATMERMNMYLSKRMSAYIYSPDIKNAANPCKAFKNRLKNLGWIDRSQKSKG